MTDPSISANWFAPLALVFWPLLAMYLYFVRPVGQATLWTVLAGFLLLPVGYVIKFEMVPPLDKYSIPTLAALVGCVVVRRQSLKFWRGFELPELLVLFFLLGPFITAELNRDPIVLPARTIPAEDLYDASSAAVFQLITILPFLLGRQFLRGSVDVTMILRSLIVTGLLYSLLMLFEIRMSPQLHTWVYGYFPSEFSQQFRYGGFRPVVFLGHGLVVAFFAATAAIAASAFWRARVRVVPIPPALVAAFLVLILWLCKTLGAALYGLTLVPMVRWTSPKAQLRVATLLVSVALAYPVLRTMDLVPTNVILELASVVSAERAGSLQTRFDNEKKLLDRASERFWFGWGRFGRNRVSNVEGLDASITDGRWIIVLGTFGVFGFVAEFGLLAVSVFWTVSAIRRTPSVADAVYVSALALIVAVGMVDLLPNGLLDPVKWLFAGALLGRAEALKGEHGIRGMSRSMLK